MIGSKISAVVDGQKLTAPLKPASIVAFEREYKVNWLAIDIADPNCRYEWMYWVAWDALKRAKLFGDTFDVFMDAVDGFVEVDATPEADAGPLPSAA